MGVEPNKSCPSDSKLLCCVKLQRFKDRENRVESLNVW